MKPIIRKINPHVSLFKNNIISHSLWCHVDHELWVRVDDKVFEIKDQLDIQINERF